MRELVYPAPVAVLVYAHPYPDRSRCNRVLLEAVADLPGLQIRSLYDLYPDFDINAPDERSALELAGLVVWQHPMYWYSVPGLLKHWFDKVLSRGWAYGEGGNALRGKRCWWVVSTGGDDQAFGAQGMHQRPFADFVPAVEQTARFCGMEWQEPLVAHGAHRLSSEKLQQIAAEYRRRMQLALADEVTT